MVHLLTGQKFQVVVPDGYRAGMCFRTELPTSGNTPKRRRLTLQKPKKHNPETVAGVLYSMIDDIVAAERAEMQRMAAAHRAAAAAAAAKRRLEREKAAMERRLAREKAAAEKKLRKAVRDTVSSMVSSVVGREKERLARERQEARDALRLQRERQKLEKEKQREALAAERAAAKLEKERQQVAKLVAQAAAKRVRVVSRILSCRGQLDFSKTEVLVQMQARAKELQAIREQKAKAKALREKQKAQRAAELQRVKAEKVRHKAF